MVERFLRFVKSQLQHYEKQVERFPPENPEYRPGQVAMYKRLVEEHKELLGYLESQSQNPDSSPPTPDTDSGRDDNLVAAEDISDLPEELLKELSEGIKAETIDQLVQIIKDRGGTANLDEVLIDLYRKHGEIAKRTQISNRLYRLANRKHIWKILGRKGIYTTTSPNALARKSPADIVDISRAKEKK